jgi:integrase
MLKQLKAYFGPRYVHELTRQDAAEWRTWRKRQVAPATVNREMALLKHVLTSAVPTYLPASPFAGDGELRVDDVDVRLLDFDEEARIYEKADAQDAALVMTALDTLMRLTSVASMRRAQDHGAYFTVLNPKVRMYKIPISTRCRTALDALEARGPALFPRYNPEGCSDDWRRNQVIRRFGELCAAADVPYGRAAGGVTFHSLRHTGASRMLAAGVDIKTVMLLGGWSNLAVLERYLHPTDEMKRRAVELISARKVEELVGAA